MPDDYSTIDYPYNNQLERETSGSSSDQVVVGAPTGESSSPQSTNQSGGISDDLWIRNWIKSVNYQPKKQGFLLDGLNGYIEANKLFIGSGGIVGGKLDIPDETTANSFHVDANGNSWWGANVATGYASAPARVLNTGAGTFSNITITGGSVATLTLNDAVQSFTNNVAFVVVDTDTVSWSAGGTGTIKIQDGTIYTIAAGNTGNMSALTYIYLDTATPTAFSTTTNYATAVGDGKILVAVAKNGTTKASVIPYGGQKPQVTGDDIVAGSILAANIAANTITANEISAAYVYAGAIAANQITAGTGIINSLSVVSTLTMGSLLTDGYIQSYGWNGTANGFQIKGGSAPSFIIIGGELTGGTIQTASSGKRIVIDNTDWIQCYDATNLIGQIYADTGELIISCNAPTNPSYVYLSPGSVALDCTGVSVTAAVTSGTSGAFYPDSGTIDLGKSTDKWAALYLSGNITVDGTVDGVDIAAHAHTGGAGGTVAHSSLGSIGASDHHSSTSDSLSITPHSVAINGATIGTAHLAVDGDFHLYTGSLDIKAAAGSIAWQGNARYSFEAANNLTYANFIPDEDNHLTCGSSGKRWSDLRSVLINGADICLENGWLFREYPATKEDIGKSREWMKENANVGIQILDDQENLIAVIHKDGYIYCKGTRSLDDLK